MGYLIVMHAAIVIGHTIDLASIKSRDGARQVFIAPASVGEGIRAEWGYQPTR